MEWYIITSLVILGIGLVVGLSLMLRRSYRVINIAAENYKRRADAYSGIEDDDPEEYEDAPSAGGGIGLSVGGIIGFAITMIVISQVVWPVVTEATQTMNVTGNPVTGTAATILDIMPIMVGLIALVTLGSVFGGFTSSSDEKEPTKAAARYKKRADTYSHAGARKRRKRSSEEHDGKDESED